MYSFLPQKSFDSFILNVLIDIYYNVIKALEILLRANKGAYIEMLFHLVKEVDLHAWELSRPNQGGLEGNPTGFRTHRRMREFYSPFLLGPVENQLSQKTKTES